MKREFVMWLIIAVLVVGALLLGTQKSEVVAIDFTNTTNQAVDYGSVPEIRGLIQKSISFSVNQDTLSGGRVLQLSPDNALADEYFIVDLNYFDAGDLVFVAGFSDVPGVWKVDGLTAGGWHKIKITYDGALTTNKPVIYIDGISMPVTEVTAPVGTYNTGTNNTFYLGYSGLLVKTIDGKISDVQIYNADNDLVWSNET